MKSIILSIVIATFNSGKSLKEALGSIFNQTFTNYEVLIIDNLSKDNTIEIINNFSSLHNNIRWISEPDKGIYDAMNKGIKMAEGEWLYFLGSDDELYNKNVLSTIFNKGKTNHKKIIYGDVKIKGDAGWAKDGQIYDGEFTLSKLIEKNICHQAIFFNREVFKRFGDFNIKYNICSDWDMNFRLWANYPFTYTNTIIAAFNGGNSSCKIVNNYTETDKWESILKYFKYKVASRKFSKYSQNILALSRYYKEEQKRLKSIILKIVFYIQKCNN